MRVLALGSPILEQAIKHLHDHGFELLNSSHSPVHQRLRHTASPHSYLSSARDMRYDASTFTAIQTLLEQHAEYTDLVLVSTTLIEHTPTSSGVHQAPIESNAVEMLASHLRRHELFDRTLFVHDAKRQPQEALSPLRLTNSRQIVTALAPEPHIYAADLLRRTREPGMLKVPKPWIEAKSNTAVTVHAFPSWAHEYALYIYRHGALVDRKFYQTSPTFELNKLESGTYHVRAFHRRDRIKHWADSYPFQIAP